MKNRKGLLVFGIVLVILFVWLSAKERNSPQIRYLSGTTMGVISYNIKYLGDDVPDLQQKIDQRLASFNASLSTYEPSSEISQLNNAGNLTYKSPFFYPVLVASKKVYDKTNGSFDPTVGPLISAWGFGPDKILPTLDSATIDSLKMLIGFDQVAFTTDNVSMPANFSVDFSAIAKGYAVDLVAELLEEKDISDYLVEIGGEVRCRGLNKKGEFWSLGIEDPTVAITEQKLLAIAALDNSALATSGNYRNYIEKDGKIFAHIVNPITGYNATHNLLSASVFTSSCMMADAYATAFMVMGLEKTRQFVNENDDVDVFLLFQDEDGVLTSFASAGIKDMITLDKTKNSSNK